VGGEIFRTYPDRPWDPSSLLYNGYFSGVKSGRDVTLTPHPLLVPWSGQSRAIPLLPLWAVGPVQSLSACTRVHFTLLLLMHGIKALGSGCNFFFHVAAAPSWLGHPHYRGFTVTFRHTTLGSTPLDE